MRTSTASLPAIFTRRDGAAGGKDLLARRRKAPRVAVVNAEFARKVFGSVAERMGGYFKMQDGTRIQVVGIVEDGKYQTLTEDQQPAMFFPFCRCRRARPRWWCGRIAIRSNW